MSKPKPQTGAGGRSPSSPPLGYIDLRIPLARYDRLWRRCGGKTYDELTPADLREMCWLWSHWPVVTLALSLLPRPEWLDRRATPEWRRFHDNWRSWLFQAACGRGLDGTAFRDATEIYTEHLEAGVEAWRRYMDRKKALAVGFFGKADLPSRSAGTVRSYSVPEPLLEATNFLTVFRQGKGPSTKQRSTFLQGTKIVAMLRHQLANESGIGTAALPVSALPSEQAIDLEEIDLRILRAFVKRGHAMKCIDLSTDVAADEDRVSDRLKYLDSKGLVRWPILPSGKRTRKGASITDLGRAELNRLKPA